MDLHVKYASIAGDLITILVLCKGLPLAYNRDLQEDKVPVFDSVKTITEILNALSESAQKITFNQDRMQKALPVGHIDVSALTDYLVQKGLISISEKDSILEGLHQTQKQSEKGEAVHINNTDLIGEAAKEIHTTKSQNDTDFLLWCQDSVDKTFACVKNLQATLVRVAMKNEGVIVPGYTHMQRAQPVLIQHHLLAYVEQLDRDAGRLLDCRKKLNFSPSAGTDFMDSLNAVSEVTSVLELLLAISVIAVHLSRLGEEWILWASEEFGFITPSDSVSTGSSIMPQKKNPDPMELVRGKTSIIVGNLVTLQTLCGKVDPFAYSRNLQVIRKRAFNCVNVIIRMLEASTEFAQNITYNNDRIQKSLPAGYLEATTLADYLVLKGIPFRTSHDIVGRAVALCVNKKCRLQDLSLKEFHSINTVFDTYVYEYLGVENSIKKFKSYGSTGSECVIN